MPWNWQQPDWPNFSWNPSRLAKAEERFIRSGGVFVGSVQHLSDEDRDRLSVEALSEEALTTSRIEGEILDRESVQSSIRRELGLATDRREVRPAERGIGELMVDVYRTFHDRLDEATVLRWHQMVMLGRTDVRDIGRYRSHDEPMQVVSGRIGDPTIHFEAPPSSRVSGEMQRFIAWFNRTSPSGAEPLPALARAGIAHLHFESIHPFEDGNGRIGRAISEKALAQCFGRPTLTALAATILLRRREYYDALEAANKHNEITDWLAWFGAICLEAQERTLALVEFLIDKTRFLRRFQDNVNARQLAALLRMLREGPAGFEGGMNAAKYIRITKTSSATATRDLGELVELGALTRSGERRGTRYHLAIPPRSIPRFSIDDAGDVRAEPRV